MKSRIPSTRLAPPDSSASWIASGFVASMFAGLSASITWPSANPHCALLRSSSGALSKVLRSRSFWAR